MRVSIQKLRTEAEATGFRVEMLEKVVRLMSVLEGLRDHPFLKGRLALKGGTALNLFVFDIPRLSVDIDLNYVGAETRDGMIKERPVVERALNAVFGREDLSVRRLPTEHAGGKWSLRYLAASGRSGALEVDVNFMVRLPLWPARTMRSRHLADWQVRDIPVLDMHELAAGKLCALLSRQRARDLFDSGRLHSATGVDPKKLRIAFVVYGAMNRRDWRTVSKKDVGFDANELANQLLPALRQAPVREFGEIEEYGRTLVTGCRRFLSAVLPFAENELAFLDLLLDDGRIEASLLTRDEKLRHRIRNQPLLQWKALHVRRHKDGEPRPEDTWPHAASLSQLVQPRRSR